MGSEMCIRDRYHVSAPTNALLSQEARDIQFEISKEVLEELTQERENEFFSLVAWESASFNDEDFNLPSPLPNLSTE